MNTTTTTVRSKVPSLRRLQLALLALAAGTLMSACAPVLVGGAMLGGALVATDRRTPGTQVEDQSIELKSAARIRELVGNVAEASEAEKHGTVGAVACDADGHLAAATSTGGYTNKPAGRVGDSPIIGAGT